MIEELLGFELFDHQKEVINGIAARVAEGHSRSLVFYPTGKGKTITALAALHNLGHVEALVVAPPATHSAWEQVGAKLGMKLTLMSHAKFRMKDTKVSRNVPIIADEFHLFGGRKGVGWKKFKAIAVRLQAPVIMLSATPNYNDAERVYCIHYILDPHKLKGGFEAFLYSHCLLEPSFRGLPDVTGFKNFNTAADYLAAQNDVYYLPDEAAYTIKDKWFDTDFPPEWKQLNYDPRTGLIMHSLMTRRISAERWALLDKESHIKDAFLRREIQSWLMHIIEKAPKNVMIFCSHSTTVRAVQNSIPMYSDGLSGGVITGETSDSNRESILEWFKSPTAAKKILVGTATLATGTDGIDKVCDTLVILQDTPDDALRRQLVGRILPRGASGNYSEKEIYRATYWLP